MVVLKEKLVSEQKTNLRKNVLMQGGKIVLTPFNYCFLAYYYLINEIKKNAHFASGTLLDVGCGSSPFKSYFLKHTEKYLKHEHPEAAKDYINYDFLSELPKLDVPSDSIDTIISFSVLEHVSEPFETIKEFKRVLKEEGTFIISVPQYWHLHAEPYDFLRFTKYILKEKISNTGFEIMYMKELGKSFAVVGQSFCNALILMFDLNHIKNIFSFLKKVKKNVSQDIGFVRFTRQIRSDRGDLYKEAQACLAPKKEVKNNVSKDLSDPQSKECSGEEYSERRERRQTFKPKCLPDKKEEKVQDIGKSILYALCKLPLILLVVILIPVINITFLILDYLIGSPRDTIGYFVIAKKKT